MTLLMLLLKSVVVVAVGAAAWAAMRNRSASTRYIVWLVTLSAVLLLPLGLLVPSSSSGPLPVFTLQAMSTAAGTPRSFTTNWTWLWLAGSIALLLRLAVQLVQAGRILSTSRHADREGDFEIRIAPTLFTPVAWGLGRKLLLLPESASDWTSERRRIVLMHETGHLQRNDCLALLIAEIACAVYWCNPLVWFAAAQMRREQEHTADDDVLAQGVSPTEYAGHLIAIARAGRTPVLAAGAVHQSDLGVRVNAILDARRVRTMATRRLLISGILALLTITLPLASMQAGRKIHKMGENGVIAPKLIYKEEPKYTEAARESKIEGGVTLEVIIEAHGGIEEATILRGLDEGLDANAVAAVKTWRFEPAQKDGEPVAVAAKVEVNFRLL